MIKIETKEDVILYYIQDPNSFLRKAISADIDINDGVREGFCELGPEYAYWFARQVDERPHDLTRKASSENPSYAYQYAWWIDQKKHPVTEQGVQNREDLRENYGRFIK
ncbi:hypothetical protein N8Z24_00815 [bacterium]|nr:hypothetical protein [bacterium]